MGFFDKVMSISESLAYVLSLRWYFSSAEGATKAQDSGDVDTELDDFFERLSADSPKFREDMRSQFNNSLDSVRLERMFRSSKREK